MESKLYRNTKAFKACLKKGKSKSGFPVLLLAACLIQSPVQANLIKNTLVNVYASGPAGEAPVEAPLKTSALGSEAASSHNNNGTGLYQAVTVSGKVTDEKGEGLPGVTILLKGTTRGTATGADGTFSLSVPEATGTLVISFIGYQTQEVPISNRASINVSLTPDMKALEEVVVVGYGRQEKRDVTGSIATIKSQDITQLPTASFDAAIQGRATGVQVAGASGVPGAPVRVLIRGTNSISSGSDPLYIVDGMPISNDLNGYGTNNGATPQNPMASINPNDIESVEVLKDAAATAIYGSRGSNGVIIITTKSGKGGKGSLNVDFSQGISDLTRTAEDIGFVNSAEYFALMDQARANSGLSPFDPMRNVNLFPRPDVGVSADPITREQAERTNTDWFDQILRTGSFRDVNVSATRGGDKFSFYTSANYREDKGVLKNNKFERFSGRVNLDFEPINNLRTGTRLNFAYTKNNRAKSLGTGMSNGFGFSQAATHALPWYPIYRFDDPTQYWNPVAPVNLVAQSDPDNILDQVDQYRGIGGVWAEYTLPWVKGLSLRTEGSFDIIQANTVYWVSRDIRATTADNDGSFALDNTATIKNYNYNLYGNYVKDFGEDHNLSITAGTESQRMSRYTHNMSGMNLTGSYQQLGNPGLRTGMTAGLGGERYIRAYFTRANYKLKDKYLLGASLRRDGSSAFSEDLRWGNFAAVSAGWIISEEEFMRSLSLINFLKLRGSFGQTGNQSIPGNVDVMTFRGDRKYGYDEVGGSLGTQVSNIGAADVTWETTDSYDLGIDFGLVQNRVSGSVVYYHRNVKDLLLQVPLPPSVQPSQIWANIGDMQNKGLEFNLTTINVDAGGFQWTTSFNITTNANKVLRLNPQADKTGSGIRDGYTLTKTGERLGTWYMADYAGIDPDKGVELIWELDQEEFAASGQTVRTGNKIPATINNLSNNRFFLEDKTTLPTYFGGFDNTFTYKGFDLNALFTFSGGNYLYDNSEKATSYAAYGQMLLRKDLIGNTWTHENRNAAYPELRWDHQYLYDDEGNPSSGTNYNNELHIHNKYLYKGDYVRLRNLQLGYTFSTAATQRLKIQGLRVFVSGTNLLTFTKFQGWDPEVVTNIGSGQSANLNQGFISSNLPVPSLRTYTAGVSVKF
ncbi:SusC/RagA family TonB-linked outer membrane protein [Pontibacter anaerobius]|uniref:TonB-dependent receptor n=1 Tax=Pontibacter anaerobius TaxID=2993940 RepID=A0ABT3RDK4_9BACT|nr:TonB-dependent receptor [Pontibacter anaerobius]MCX2739506.1 TonB-dependent receptor [Pontibacter anaerobius]